MVAVHKMHVAYIKEVDVPVEQIAARFGIGTDWMYKLFHKAALPLRTDGQRDFGPDEVKRMHEGYLRSALPPWEYVKLWGIGHNRMYRLFDQEGLSERRRRGRKRQEPTRNSERCPCATTHLFCASCPCPPPEWCQDWECEECEWGLALLCPCQSAELRAQAGWESAYQEWDKERRKRDRQVTRMRARADGGPIPVLAEGRLSAHLMLERR